MEIYVVTLGGLAFLVRAAGEQDAREHASETALSYGIDVPPEAAEVVFCQRDGDMATLGVFRAG